MIGGVPTIAGAWLGGFVYSPVLSVAVPGLGAGAIAQVIGADHRGDVAGRPFADCAAAPMVAGLFAGFGVMYVTGMLVG